MMSKLTRCPVCGSEYTTKAKDVSSEDLETLLEMAKDGSRKEMISYIEFLLREITRDNAQ